MIHNWLYPGYSWSLDTNILVSWIQIYKFFYQGYKLSCILNYEQTILVFWIQSFLNLNLNWNLNRTWTWTEPEPNLNRTWTWTWTRTWTWTWAWTWTWTWIWIWTWPEPEPELEPDLNLNLNLTLNLNLNWNHTQLNWSFCSAVYSEYTAIRAEHWVTCGTWIWTWTWTWTTRILECILKWGNNVSESNFYRINLKIRSRFSRKPRKRKGQVFFRPIVWRTYTVGSSSLHGS